MCVCARVRREALLACRVDVPSTAYVSIQAFGSFPLCAQNNNIFFFRCRANIDSCKTILAKPFLHSFAGYAAF